MGDMDGLFVDIRVASGAAANKGLETRKGDDSDGERHLEHAERIYGTIVSQLFAFGHSDVHQYSVDLQTRFSWPVPILRQAKRTMVVKMVRVPKTKVTARPVEAVSTPWISKIRGMA